LVKKSGRKYAFASNEEYNENDPDLAAKKVCEQYRKRWGIETSYRVKKHTFLPKTTSKNYFVRMFYFFLSVLLYNLWILLDILLCLMVLGVKTENHIITSKLFGTIFYIIRDG
jgi:putative transposase